MSAGRASRSSVLSVMWQKALNCWGHFDKGAELGNAGDLTRDLRADLHDVRRHHPWIFRELLDAERDALLLDVDIEEHDVHDIVDLVRVRWFHAIGP